VNQPSPDFATPEQVFLHIEAAARELGFGLCAHGLRMPLPVTRPYTAYLSNYPPEWQARYTEQKYLEIDPTVAHGMRSSEPVLWNEEFFAKAPQLWSEAQSHGLKHGWAQSRRDPEGTFSLLVLARSEGAITISELADKASVMKQLVEESHERMKACCAPEFRRPQHELSDREIDVLRWTADGKTAAEIAEILGVSERTVNFHVNNIVTKLGASNKINAAVRAATLGLIW
jgi:LuxR family transcriptional regulator, quorum-sensing system regulator SolR